jgi:rare lipoprotein A
MLVLLLAGCGSAPKLPGSDNAVATKPHAKQKSSDSLPVLPPAGSGRGGYYQDDGPGDSPPPGLLDTPDAEPKVEPYLARTNKPYTVFGKTYTPLVNEQPFKQRGIGSWYGKKFHGQKTSSGELYDMYKMTAAHPTLPIPSYARVTNLANGKQVIVRINDRGPFHSNRIIDLSYTAALKLGYLGTGSSQLEVERLLPEDIARINARKREEVAQVEQTMSAADLSAPGMPAEVAAAPRSATTENAADTIETMLNSMPTAQPPAVSTMAATDATASGFYVQLGAYGQRANAEAARDRLARNTASPLQVIEAGPVYRVYSGPFATRADAIAAAQRLQESGSNKPMIVQR